MFPDEVPLEIDDGLVSWQNGNHLSAGCRFAKTLNIYGNSKII